MLPFPIQLWVNEFREPDVTFMAEQNLPRCRGKYREGADLVVEVVSDSNRTVDLETKRVEYTRAGIPEYWIVDPRERSVTLLRLREGIYELAACAVEEGRIPSAVVPGWSVNVAELLSAR